MEHPKYAENLVKIEPIPVRETEVLNTPPHKPRDLTRKQRRALEARIAFFKNKKAELDFKNKMLVAELERINGSQS